MRSAIAYFIKYPVLANLVMALILIFGMFGLFDLKSTFFPLRESKVITINVTYPGASPEEIEEGVVLKIEDNLEGVTGIDRVKSTSQESSASITIEVEEDYDTDLILQDVKNEVDRISSFPEGMEAPEIYKQENLNDAISFALSGEVSLKALKEEAQLLEDELRAKEGISKITLSGFPAEEVEIALSEKRMRAYDLTFQEVANAVSNSNLEITGGRIERPQEEMLIRAKSKEYHAKGFKKIVVKADREGQVVRLGDLANVRDEWADDPNRTYLNDKRAVIIDIKSTIKEDILFITDFIRDRIKSFNKEHDAIQASIVDDQSTSLRGRIQMLVENGILGLLLVMVFLSLFLHIRLAFWVAIAIPISFMGMFLCAPFYGLTINVISLFGMIMVIGILVDDGIVFAEIIYQKWEKGEPPLKAAINGTMEVLPPVTGGILTTIVAFLIFFFLEGRIGDFITDMAFVVIFALIFSLIEGAVILPAHVGHSKALEDRGTDKNLLNRNTDRVFNWVKDRVYRPFLRFALYNKVFTIGASAALLMLTIGAFQAGTIKTTFFPSIERKRVDVSLEMPSGTQDPITEKWLDHIKRAAERVNDSMSGRYTTDSLPMITGIQKKIGPSTSKGDLELILQESGKRQLPSYKVTNAVRKEAGRIPGAENVTYGQGTPFGKPISISLLSKDLSALEKAKQELKQELERLASVKDVTDNDQAGLREVQIELKDKARMLGLDLRTVIQQVRSGFFGKEVQRLQRGLDEVKVWVRYGESERRSIGKLERMRIRHNGDQYPLGELATFNVDRGILSIDHLNGNREITVSGDLSDPDGSATAILENVQNKILPPILAKYPGIRVSYEGQSRESQKTASSGARVVPVVLILMIGIVTFLFRSLGQALVVFIVLPLGFIGVGWGHYLMGSPISILSIYGVIALIGIMINDSLVLVNRMNNLLKGGKDFMTAVHDAALSRFRAILLTSITTIGGLAPLMLAQSFQAQFVIPMAISVAFGMIAATLITLMVLPCFLVIQNQAKVHLAWLWTGQKPAMKEMEPGAPEVDDKGDPIDDPAQLRS